MHRVFDNFKDKFLWLLYGNTTLQALYYSAYEKNISLEKFEVFFRRSLERLGSNLREEAVSEQERESGNLISTPWSVWTAYAICNKIWGDGRSYLENIITPQQDQRNSSTFIWRRAWENLFQFPSIRLFQERTWKLCKFVGTLRTDTVIWDIFFERLPNYQVKNFKVLELSTIQSFTIRRTGLTRRKGASKMEVCKFEYISLIKRN